MFTSCFEKKNLQASIITKKYKTDCGEIFCFYITIKDDIISNISFDSLSSMKIYKSLHLLCFMFENLSLKEASAISEEYFLQKYQIPLYGENRDKVLIPLKELKKIVSEYNSLDCI